MICVKPEFWNLCSGGSSAGKYIFGQFWGVLGKMEGISPKTRFPGNSNTRIREYHTLLSVKTSHHVSPSMQRSKCISMLKRATALRPV